MLVHALRNSLAPTTSAANLLAVIETSEDRIQHINGVIFRLARHITERIDALLDVSRVTKDISVLNRQPVRVRHGLQKAIAQITSQSEKGAWSYRPSF